MLCLVAGSVFILTTFVVPSLLPRGRWWTVRPRMALMLWHGTFVTGCLSGLVALTALLWEAWTLRNGVQGVGQGLLAEFLLASIMVPSTAVLAFFMARLERVVGSVIAERRAMAVLVRQFGRSHPEAESLDCEVVVLPTQGGIACSLVGQGPRVFVSDGLLADLSAAEVRAVILHEHAHVRQRHDLWCLVGEVAEAWAPRLPAARGLRRATALLVELAADDYARRFAGQPATASALATLAQKYPDTSYAPRALRAARG